MDARLRQAVAVGRFGSFSKAADMIGVTQSAVTKSVADLERRVGYPIFHRTSKGTVATEEGRIFLERALRLLTDTADLLGAEKPDLGSGILRVGIFPATLDWLLPKALERLLRRYPGIRLDITTGTRDRGVELLGRGDVDVAIGIESTYLGRPQFKCSLIATLVTTAFVRQGHPLLAMEAPTPADIGKYLVILPSEIWDSSPFPALQEAYDTERTDWYHRIENVALSCKVVEASDAIGLVDAGFPNSDYFRRKFTVLDGFRPLPPVRIHAAVREQWEPKPGAAALIAILQQVHAAADPQADMENRMLAHELGALPSPMAYPRGAGMSPSGAQRQMQPRNGP